MKKMYVILGIVVALTLTACGSQGRVESAPEVSQNELETLGDELKSMPEGSSRPAVPAPQSDEINNTDVLTAPEIEGTIIEEYIMKGAFTPSPRVETSRESYLLCEGTPMETEVVHLVSPRKGETLYIVGGVHGNEKAGFTAAAALTEMELASGELYILAPANASGARRNNRYVIDREDLNRSFPGAVDGSQSEQLAYAILEDIKRADPVFVFDLHEAIVSQPNRDFLGSSLIYTKLDGMETLFFDLITTIQGGELCSESFDFFGPGPHGSINDAVTNLLEIPTVTVETYRGYPLERRVDDQLAVVGYVLKYYQMI